MTDISGNKIKIGDKIRAVIKGDTCNHILTFHDSFKMDLSDPVTVRIDNRGVLMAGQISLQSYEHRLVEIVL